MVQVAKRNAIMAAVVATASICLAGEIAPLRAQEVVQSLPSRETAELNTALRRLASRPTDLDALLSAGDASLALNDAGAAAGFFGRAARVASGDARVLLGLARVALAQRRPVEALQLFSQAENAGVRSLDMAADRALAFDLVGDNAAAQTLYLGVLAKGERAEVRRRLALSYAIAGNRNEFERVLYPLLRDEDRAAYRTRAFGLAILGQADDAVEIADAMMPTDLALRMAPYLRYMPRLTRSQQAAAGNLGAFPAATEIGRDSADIASYTGMGARIAANANAALTPAGAPLGPRAQQSVVAASAAVRRRPDREEQPSPAPAAVAAPEAVSLARAEQTRSIPEAAVPSRSAEPSSAAPPPARESLSEAFADLGAQPVAATSAAAGAVDVVKLAAARKAAEAAAAREADAKAKAKREADAKAAKVKAEKAAREAEPARVWVQVGVGRNTAAFAFDWKKLAKQAGGALDGKGPWAARYGATNRMLAGPFPSEAAARATMKRLKDKDIEALPFTSDEGEKVTKIS